MDEEQDNEDNIEIYKANFKYDNNDSQINEIYKIIQIEENNDVISKKIIKKRYNHPLFLNYNYCLICLERRKTKYNEKNLYEQHKKANLNKVFSFLQEKNIKLKKPINKKQKLAKRRFIHSLEHKQKDFNLNNKFSGSDTELYIEDKEKLKDKKKLSRKSSLLKKSSKFSTVLKMNSSFNSNNSNNNGIRKSKSKSINRKVKQTKTLILKNSKISKNFIHQNKAQSNKELIYNSNSIFKRRDRKILTKNTNPFSFFGFVLKPFDEKKNNDTRDLFMNTIDEGETQYYEKNEKCGICLGDIKDKFTLFCGDFFCRECIINLLKESINDVARFDELSCPRCHEPINENTIKFLLKGNSLRKYNKLKMRIEGLKDNQNIPCPHPDCEGFARKDREKNETYECQNNHVFCKKCLEEIDPIYRKNKKKKHKCDNDKYPETEEFLNNNKNIKKCPKCKSWVEREPGGCNYFTCTNIWCKYQFCWICGNKYEDYHYKNPLSACFRLAESDYQGKLIKSNRIRRIRCILIILLLILILFPIICLFFSFFAIFSFVLYYQFDGKELRNIRIHSNIAKKVFYIIFFAFIFLIALALIPFGYMCLALLIIAIPIIIIIKKARKKKDDF